MTDEPTKAAIERWHYLVFGDADVSFDEMNRQRRGMIGATEACRYIDQVSETAKYGQAFIEQALGSFVFDEPTANLAYEAEEGLRTLILPDPEPDVLAEAMFEYFDMQRITQGDADGVRQMLKKRGYAITKIGEAGQ